MSSCLFCLFCVLCVLCLFFLSFYLFFVFLSFFFFFLFFFSFYFVFLFLLLFFFLSFYLFFIIIIIIIIIIINIIIFFFFFFFVFLSFLLLLSFYLFVVSFLYFLYFFVVFCLFFFFVFLSFCIFVLLSFCLFVTTIIITWSISTTTQIFVPIRQFFNFGAGARERKRTLWFYSTDGHFVLEFGQFISVTWLNLLRRLGFIQTPPPLLAQWPKYVCFLNEPSLRNSCDGTVDHSTVQYSTVCLPSLITNFKHLQSAVCS